ncbi:MAG: hemolysin III family protein [Lachnospiraceae bacterium]|nr:hemolysin III family protein [Lachnospiraceae bacterium]
MNMVTHIAGGAFALAAAVLLIVCAASYSNAWGVVSGAVYAGSMLLVFVISSVYHGMKVSTGKLVLRVLDHCDIFFLIAGTYTPILLTGIRLSSPVLAWVIFGIEWGSAALGVVLNAIDLKKYDRLSMVCYLVMGWCIVICIPAAIKALTLTGFFFLLGGGVAFSIGALCYRIGRKKRYIHSVFHIFVVIGAVLQFISIWLYLFRPEILER